VCVCVVVQVVSIMGCSNSSHGSGSGERTEPVNRFACKYALGKKFGSGTLAQIRTVVVDLFPSAKIEKAVKIIETRGDRTFTAEMEGMLWKAVCCHRNIVELHECFIGAPLSYMVMEKCSCLMLHLLQAPLATEREFGKVFSQMLFGLGHVHSFGVVHCDVKLGSFMIGDDGVTVKLYDFGSSTRLNPKEVAFKLKGTAPFMCPEMLQHSGYCKKADIWSLGVLVYTFMFGAFPYEAETKGSADGMKKAIIEGTPPTFAPVLEGTVDLHNRTVSALEFRSADAVSFVKCLLDRWPSQRPSASEALRTKYIEAVLENRHEQGVDLPTLQPMLLSAEREGAYEMEKTPCERDSIDSVLLSSGMIEDDACNLQDQHVHSPVEMDDCKALNFHTSEFSEISPSTCASAMASPYTSQSEFSDSNNTISL